MKKTNENNELKGLTAEELVEKVNVMRRELFSLRLNSSTAHVKDYSQFKKFRRQIACALTLLQQKKSLA